ncbi:hypothetical protein ZHAS_00002711 [Anopheles sinensis]|uniref:Chitin-binding type-2 domain-containing protein n=1 Tax=Anopheles sinensis TaxID=74873 RepID=A0A084VCU9_ANOSI|nr:hypothetical protein ZHAS_00002711 [Anopheles sinensis]
MDIKDLMVRLPEQMDIKDLMGRFPEPMDIKDLMEQHSQQMNIKEFLERQAKESIPRHQNCPRSNGYYPVYFRNSKDCSQYYQCDQGTAYLIQCPAGLHFNTRINVCDYPQNVDCSGPVLVSPTYPSSSSGEGRTSPSCPICQHARNVIPKHPNCPRSNGYYPAYFRHPTDCSTFYQCDNGSAYEIQCPAGLHFNTLLSVCDYPAKTGCSVTSGGVQESTSHTNGHQGFDGSASRTNGHQGSDGSASRTNGHQGSAGAVFPTNGHQGVPGAVSQTNDHPKPGGSCNICRQAKESIPRHQNCPRTNGYYPVYFRNSKECSQYYQCDQGTAYLIQCPAELYFNNRINVCDYPQNVDCSGPVLVSPTYPSSSSGEGRTSPSCPICQHARNVIPKHPNCPRSNGYYPAYFRHPTDCSTFYQCDNGSAYEIQCPAGLHFNTLLSNQPHIPMAIKDLMDHHSQQMNIKDLMDQFPEQMDIKDLMVLLPEQMDIKDLMEQHSQLMDIKDLKDLFPEQMDIKDLMGRLSVQMDIKDLMVLLSEQMDIKDLMVMFPGQMAIKDLLDRFPKVMDTRELMWERVANYWANPRDCTKYYGCLWGCVEELSCPGGYRWHDGKKACVEERLVRC